MKSPLTKSWKSSIHEHFIFNTRNHICYMVHDLFPVPTHSQVSSPSFCSGLCLGDQPLLFLSCWLSLIGLVNQKPCKNVGSLEEREIPGRLWGICDNSPCQESPSQLQISSGSWQTFVNSLSFGWKSANILPWWWSHRSPISFLVTWTFQHL